MKARNNRGVTLVELIIACAIAATIITAAAGVMLAGIKTYNTNFRSTVGQQSLRTAMLQVTRQLRNAQAGTVTIAAGRTLKIGATSFSIASGKLMYGTNLVADGISGIRADYTDAGHEVIQVELTAADGNVLSTQIRVN